MFFFWTAPSGFRLVTWGLLADQRGIEPPPAVCPRHKNAAIPTGPRRHLYFYNAGCPFSLYGSPNRQFWWTDWFNPRSVEISLYRSKPANGPQQSQFHCKMFICFYHVVISFFLWLLWLWIALKFPLLEYLVWYVYTAYNTYWEGKAGSTPLARLREKRRSGT